MKKGLWRVISLFVAMCLLFSLAACGGKTESTPKQETKSDAKTEPAKKEPVKLRLSHMWGQENDGNAIAMKKVMEGIAKDLPDIKFEVDASGSGYDQKIKTIIASGDVPDVFSAWGAAFSKPFAESGALLQLDEYLKDGTKDKLVGGTLDNFTYGGKVYAFPTTLAIGSLFCNKEIFEQNGLKIPETFDDLINAAKVLSAKGIKPLIIGEKDDWTGMFLYDIIAIRTAGTKASTDALTGKVSFEQPEFIEAAKKLQEFVKAGGINKDAFGIDWNEAQAQFIQGKGAMLFNGTWTSGTIEKAESLVKGKVVAVKFPTISGGKGTATEFFGGPNDCIEVSATTKHKEEAVRAAKYIAEGMSREGYLVGTGLPAWKISGVDTSKLNPLLVQQADMIKSATAYMTWWDVFLPGDKATKHKSLIAELLALKKTPEQYVKDMQQVISGK